MSIYLKLFEDQLTINITVLLENLTNTPRDVSKTEIDFCEKERKI